VHLTGAVEGRFLVVEMAAEEPLKLAAVPLQHLRVSGGARCQRSAIGVEDRMSTHLGGELDEIRINGGVKRRRNASRDDKPVAGTEPLSQARLELGHVLEVCLRARVAQNRIDVTGFVEDRDVGPHFAFGVQEVTGDALRIEGLLDVAPESARREAHRQALAAQLVDDARDIDPLAAGIGADGLHANRISRNELGQDERVIDGWVKRDGDYHSGSGKIIA